MMLGIFNYTIVTLAVLFPIANQIKAVPAFYDLTATGTLIKRKQDAQQIATTRPDISYLRQKLIIMTDPPQKGVIDDEVQGATSVTIESIPNSLTVLSPQNEAP